MKTTRTPLKQHLLVTLILISILFISCQSKTDKTTKEVVLTSEIELPEKPNILWLVTEDMGSYIPSFGDSTIVTPNLSRLAKEGVVYPNLYSTSGVCAPSRAAITTGMYPSSIGATHMRTTSYPEVTGLPIYGAVPPPEVRMVSELLRKNGYYCTNNDKQDYQFTAPLTAWDESSSYAHWRNRDGNQPFFSVFNFTDTHESGLFEPYGFRNSETRHYHSGDRNYKWEKGRMTEGETPVHLPKDTKFSIPRYLPDTPKVHRDMWKMYNNIAEMDRQVGAVLKQLEDDGLLENTIIFFYGDHGGPLPREKRLIYDSGLNTPMIVRFPNQQQAETKRDELISFVDFAPTLLSLAGVEPPEYLQGQAFLGIDKVEKERKYIHAAADRFDGFTDAIRAVRDDRYKYIRNYRPEQGYYLPVEYRERIPTMKELLRLRDEGNLDSIQSLWFRENKDVEELYDCKTDPYEVNNLAKNPAYKEKLEELRNEMDRWLNVIGDQPNLPERELIAQLWKGEESQPITSEPEITIENNKIKPTCSTEGASLGYKVMDKDGTTPKVWEVYQEPFEIPEGSKIIAQAYRIGYKPSKVVEYRIIDNEKPGLTRGS
ncbi:sulfatase-like hydrolase/transferase [Zobellia alginiliquefaciens]|uniref:sulfatase-like hydrolase/transferase n=1 Tax=Zobellia alginiliquefaciens TaxID=3032586 RepID=UPI0023E45F55|nr:sulfatase-like hydrolase/transferase [Zobellia alginiliquefaciens]